MTKKPKVVIDLDGVIFNIHKCIEANVKKKGFDNYSCERILTYDLNQTLQKPPSWLALTACNNSADNFLNVPRELLFAEFINPQVFEDAELFEDILEPLVELCDVADVVFNSLAYSREIVDIKIRRVQYLLEESNFGISCFIGKHKPSILGADYVIEDNPYDLTDYIGSSSLCLANRCYNAIEHNSHCSTYSSVNENLYMRGSTACILKSLVEIIKNNK